MGENATKIPVRTAPQEPEKVLTPEEINEQKQAEVRQLVSERVDSGATATEIAQEFGITEANAREFSIRRRYDTGRGSIQDYARIYHLEVREVLDIVGQSELSDIQFIGDLVDQEYVGNQSTANAVGQSYKIPYDVK